jgi:hypothetical protein
MRNGPIFGAFATPALGWMGKNSFSESDARTVLATFSADVKDTTILRALAHGSNPNPEDPHWINCARFTPEQERELLRFKRQTK